MKNNDMRHGLFGRIDSEQIENFEDYKDVAKLVYSNTKKGITLYRSVVSVTEEIASELMLDSQKSWQNFIENHIITIAQKNKIKRENLAFACAVHGEKSHPHIHIAFWDTSENIKNPYVKPSVVNDIRKQIIKDTFRNKILEFAKNKDSAVKSIRDVTDDLVNDFEQEMNKLKQYKKIKSNLNHEQINSFFSSDFLANVTDKVFDIKANLPEHGRIVYKLLSPEVKGKVDELVLHILENKLELQILKTEYVESKIKMASLYGEVSPDKRTEYEAQADKIIANDILGMVKTINRLESEGKTQDYLQKQKEFLVVRMLSTVSDAFKSNSTNINPTLDTQNKKMLELSKQAKKDIYLKLQDKGYEH